MAATKGRGRPIEYNEEEAEIILEELSKGRSLASICREIGRAPTTIYRWEDNIEDFRNRYARAREWGMHSRADEIIDLSNQADSQNYNAIRVMIDARKWTMSKIAPKHYGDRLTTEVTGKDGKDLPISIVIGQKELK